MSPPLARRALLLAVVAAVCAAGPAAARGPLRQKAPLFVRLEGRVGPPSEATKGAEDWQLSVGNKTERFQLVRLTVMGGEASSGDVIHALEPYKPQLRLNGPKGVVAKLGHVKPEQDVTILGYLQGAPGTTRLMVSSVEAKDAAGSDRKK